jgi:ubiquinone biosynthesis protein UbiJ
VPTIPLMFDTLQQLATTAFLQRVTLWLNHVIAGEDAAVARLRPHAGRSIRIHLTGWPSLLPQPALSFSITRAGLLDWTGNELAAEADLTLAVDASNPARMLAQGLAGQRPTADVSGDSALASDVSWLMDNLRWDVEDDLARFIGEAPAHELARFGRPVAQAMRSALAAIAGFVTGQGGASQEPPAR